QIIDEYSNSEEYQNVLNEILIQRVFPLKNAQISIIDNTGKTIASTIQTNQEGFLEHKNSVVIAALAGKENFSKTKKDTNEISNVKSWLSYGYPVLDNNNKVAYVIYAQIDANTVLANLRQTTNTIAISVCISLFFAIILGSLFSNTITAPISILTKKANLLAKGNLEQHVSVKGEDEIGQLTRSFNHMARELRKTVSEMENENNKLEILLHNMTDGVVAFDHIGSLIHANKVFYKLMELREAEEYKVNLNFFLKKIKFEKKDLNIEKNTEILVDVNGKFIQVVLIPYKAKYGLIDGVMVVLQDITKQKKLDDLRKEFVANVSHEIRTPITTIKSYTETLIDGAIEEKDLAIDFLNTINEASDRVKLLTDDLLELSKFDGGKISFNFKEDNLYEIVLGCVKQNIITANNKNQKIILNEPKNKNMPVYVDTGRINQVINNIISNSMKYSYENTEIKIFFDEFKDSYVVTIQDNGIGIPQEDIDRIFERFYRVDKARSRAMGGNGLGLSIAKEIMTEHKGDIKVFSKVSEGTVMQIIFPKNIHIQNEDNM
ncbi:MAG: cell wall metabolism sensor histidine kinase WalK, partial [Eubacteriales bacterium]|nr:cell wall metabolism sensor histidine kinase WalK [Eubacteriales bacterium]